MAFKLTDQRDMDFVLYEQFKVDSFLTSEKYQTFNKRMFDMVIKEAKNLAVKEIFPTYTQCDKEGVVFENGVVKVPECLRRPHKLLKEGEWSALTESPEYGGQGLPFTIAQAAMEYLTGANYVLTTYPILSHGAGKMIDLFGTGEQKDLFLKKLYTGAWGGTMLLTEPGAGSDVGALTTSAKKMDDGTYDITGSKIFITNGEQNLTDNIIHPVLARIEGAPAGTRGISLFIVEKGTPGFSSHEMKKLGMRSSKLAELVFKDCRIPKSQLLGPLHKGFRSSIKVLSMGRAIASAFSVGIGMEALRQTVEHTKIRYQGGGVLAKKQAIRFTLADMETRLEASRLMAYSSADLIDKGKPFDLECSIAKVFATETVTWCCERALHLHGAQGYMMDSDIQRFYRDCKVLEIGEGTNEIQREMISAMLLG